jgi:hypothetical protein
MLLAPAQLRAARVAVDELSRRFLRLRASSIVDASLAGGLAGTALVHAALDEVFAGRGHAAAAERALDRALDALGTTALTPSLYSGFTGVGWAAEFLAGDPGAHAEEDPLLPIDMALETYLDRSGRWKEPYDLIEGLVGIGVYALERCPRASARRLVQRVVDRLAETARVRDPGVSWWSDPKWEPPKSRRKPHFAFNLGMAHGVPGVIALLGRVLTAAVDAPTRKKARALLLTAVEWLLAQELPAGGSGCFANAVGRGVAHKPARLAWCYGDAGVAAALLIAARGARKPAWENAAMRVALRAAARPVESAQVVDVGLCHGAAGLAHIFHRFFLETGEQRLRAASRLWFARTLAMRVPRRGFAGFRAWELDERGKLSWQSGAGFLTGAAGVTLALIAATTDVAPKWDRVLLLS